MKNNVISRKRVAFFLTIVGGFLEIYSYLLLGNVFATTITGNLILMAFNLKRLQIINVVKYVLPIIFFCFGVFVSEKIKSKMTYSFAKVVLVVEIVILSLIPFINVELISVSLIAFISAIQIQTFRKVSENLYMSTMCTGNTRSLIESLVNGKSKDAKNYFVVIFGFLLGVLLGDISIIFTGKFSIYICVLILSSILVYLIKKEGKDEVIR
ncbi:YoaK family protein [Streptobacillus felis]|uniref:DUF1275 domain-containing protein n=1 Tax=Streptobacillus felis TaxID=1384509 RepID=A0A7Z0PGK3_9FUSO|nr:YoaK family protein [Streptobacillus felis]NYV28308.1 DUF1275 domain-containing protein [Streptobacillus felis]